MVPTSNLGSWHGHWYHDPHNKPHCYTGCEKHCFFGISTAMIQWAIECHWMNNYCILIYGLLKNMLNNHHPSPSITTNQSIACLILEQSPRSMGLCVPRTDGTLVLRPTAPGLCRHSDGFLRVSGEIWLKQRNLGVSGFFSYGSCITNSAHGQMDQNLGLRVARTNGSCEAGAGLQGCCWTMWGLNLWHRCTAPDTAIVIHADWENLRGRCWDWVSLKTIITMQKYIKHIKHIKHAISMKQEATLDFSSATFVIFRHSENLGSMTRMYKVSSLHLP